MELVYVSVLEAEFCGFESHPEHHIKAHKSVGHADIVGHIASAMPVLVRFDSLQMCFYMVKRCTTLPSGGGNLPV